MKINTKISSIAFSFALATSSHAALVHANGHVTLVSQTTFDHGVITTASDGSSAFNGNGEIYTNASGYDYFASQGPIVMDMDLGSLQSFDGVAFWNRGWYQGNSTKTFTVQFSADGDFTDSEVFTFTAGKDIGGDQQDFKLSGHSQSNISVVDDVRYARVSITDNFAEDGPGGDRVAFTEFQFNAVPEPSSTALLGIAGIALILRRKK